MIGAGICGAFSAYLLADRGCRVTVIDPARPQGTASTHNPGGLNPLHGPGIPGPMGDFALEALALHQAHPDWISGLQKLQALDATTAGLDVAWIEPEVFRRIEPAAHPSIRGALRLQGNA